MLNKLTGYVRRCIDDYNMIEKDEAIAVGVSGGKDSMVLLRALAELRSYHPTKFALHAVTLDMGISGMDFTPVENLCKELDVPLTLKQSDIARILFYERKEKNPCSLCATMRRAALCNMITELGIKKIALAHHYDDAIETFLLSLLYEGRIHCFQPVTYLDRTDVTQIRPMLYVEEKKIKRFVESVNMPIVYNPCPMNRASKREEVKTLLKTLEPEHKDIKSKLFGAMKRFPLTGWEEKEPKKY
ncbi:MAG: tRNA 2-thiocytidine biosynthesis TtcA family protein [Oscillospiraceae bacterium]|jgi:tRNA(Ile)-lysidine synthase TilS/MesJ|nr:tRNA 2-thiocytidine biosynthesis TtcA family protein [Oscillospiraceae bacterium]